MTNRVSLADPTPPPLDHLRHLTDHTGLAQHAFHHLPDHIHGHTLDDNARALAVAVGLQRAGVPADDLIDRYLAFVRFAAVPGAPGAFRNVLHADRTWASERSDDADGHAVAALGYTVARATHPDVRAAASDLVRPALAHVGHLRSARGTAHSLIGLAWLRAAGWEVGDLLAQLSESLLARWKATCGDGWGWFEDELTYDNGRLPLALLAASTAGHGPGGSQGGPSPPLGPGGSQGGPSPPLGPGGSQGGPSPPLSKARAVELAALDFLIGVVCPDGMVDLVGNRGWYRRGQERAVWDQQPVDAASLAEACAGAWRLTGEARYQSVLLAAAAWFSGRNRGGAVLYDPATGACRDGLEAGRTNPNRGAESTLAAFQTWLAVHDPEWALPMTP